MPIDRKKFFMLALSLSGGCVVKPAPEQTTTPVKNEDHREVQPTDEQAYGGGGDQCVAWDEMTGECTQWAPAGEAYGGYNDQCVAWDEMTGECTQWAPANEQTCVAWDEMTGECTYWAPAGEGGY